MTMAPDRTPAGRGAGRSKARRIARGDILTISPAEPIWRVLETRQPLQVHTVDFLSAWQRQPGFEDAPDRLGLVEIVEDIDPRDAARFRPCRRLAGRRSITAAMVIAKLSAEKVTIRR